MSFPKRKPASGPNFPLQPGQRYSKLRPRPDNTEAAFYAGSYYHSKYKYVLRATKRKVLGLLPAGDGAQRNHFKAGIRSKDF